MTVAELFPTLRGLTRADKLKVMQFLITELAQEEEPTYNRGQPTRSGHLSILTKRLTNWLNSWNRNNRRKMRNAQRFNFIEGFDAFGVPDALPQLPLSLTYRDPHKFIRALFRLTETIGDADRVLNDLDYRELCVNRLLEIVLYIDNYIGSRRIFIP